MNYGEERRKKDTVSVSEDIRRIDLVSFAKNTKERIENYVRNSSYGIKAKLIFIFILIKIIPVILLSWVAWNQIVKLGDGIEKQSHDIIAITRNRVGEIG